MPCWCCPGGDCIANEGPKRYDPLEGKEAKLFPYDLGESLGKGLTSAVYRCTRESAVWAKRRRPFFAFCVFVGWHVLFPTGLGSLKLVFVLTQKRVRPAVCPLIIFFPYGRGL